MTTLHPVAFSASHTSGRARADVFDALVLGVLLALFVLLAAAFLPHQSIWIDETTQLSGIKMTPGEVLTFLTGGHAPIGVPPDRNPPLSYWAGQAWCVAFGFSEHALRWFGITCVAGAIAAVFMTARRAGRWPAIIAAAFLALSPNIATSAVEIRPYPLFLLLAALAFYVFGGILAQAESTPHARRRAAMLALLLIAAIYTHFFGVILAGAILAAWLGDVLLRRRRILQPAAATGLVMVVACGLYPFIHTASSVSGQPAESASFMGGLVGLPVHLFTHPAMRLNGIGLPQAVVPVLALLAACAALLLGAMKALQMPRARGFVLAAAAGFAAVAGAGLVISKFNPLSSNYNIWIVPPLAVLIGLGALSRWGRAAGVVLIAVIAFGSGQFVAHAQAFAHGVQNQVLALIDGYGPANVTMIQDAGVDGGVPFGMLFPLRYRYRAALQRYSVAMPAGDPVLFYDDNQRTANPNDLGSIAAQPLPPDLTRYVIVIRNADLSGAQLAAAIRNGPAPLGDGPAAKLLNALPNYRRIAAPFFVAMDAADVDVYESIDNPSTAP